MRYLISGFLLLLIFLAWLYLDREVVSDSPNQVLVQEEKTHPVSKPISARKMDKDEILTEVAVDEIDQHNVFSESVIGAEAVQCINALPSDSDGQDFYGCIPLNKMLKILPFLTGIVDRQKTEDLKRDKEHRDRYLMGIAMRHHECFDQTGKRVYSHWESDPESGVECRVRIEYPDAPYWQHDLDFLRDLARGNAEAAAVLSYRLSESNPRESIMHGVRASLLSNKWGPIARAGGDIKRRAQKGLEKI